MSTNRIGIVADVRRMAAADVLANLTAATVLSYDDGTLGCTRNHIKVWTKVLQHGGDWAVVLEDDALPCNGFREQLDEALASAPTDIVGLYLGRSYPRAWQRFIKRAMTTDAHYIKASHLLHGVGTAIRMELVPDMLRFVGNMAGPQQDWPIDEQITHWARLRGHQVSYTKPSIVQHGDFPTLLVHPDGQGRKLPRRAWAFGNRGAGSDYDDWGGWDGTKVVEIP